MAGLTSTFPFKPILLYRPHRTTFPPSCFFGLRLPRTTTSATTLIPISLISRTTSVSARSSGGGGGPYRRSPPEEDRALDISSIRSDQVRLIDEQQNMVGIVSKNVALQMAEDAELDLVILSPDADPPVVRIMDYNKYRYEQQKKKKGQQKKSAAGRMDLKELKMGFNIDVHDYSVRLRQAQKFLKDGDKVKVIVNLKGRENEFRNNAIELLGRFQNDLGEMGDALETDRGKQGEVGFGCLQGVSGVVCGWLYYMDSSLSTPKNWNHFKALLHGLEYKSM